MEKPYTWEEIKEVLSRELKKTKHILTFGTIGSCDINNDIDVIITKKPRSKTSDFYKEIHEVFDFLNNYLKDKHSTNLIRFSTMTEEQVLLYFQKDSEKVLRFHTMVYCSYPQIELDWSGAQEADLNKIFGKDHSCLKGDNGDLENDVFMKSNYYDSTYNFLYHTDKINSGYPEKLIIRIVDKLLDYLSRKRLGLKPIRVKDFKEVRDKFYLFCDELDKLEKKKK